MKRLVDLTLEDLRASPVWRYEGGSGAEAQVEPARRDALSRSDDEIFLAATAFELRDGTRHQGFCFPADDSGIDYLQPAIVTDAGHVYFWFDGPADEAMIARQWKALAKEPREIFPVAFRCLVPVDGREVSGRIDGLELSPEAESAALEAIPIEPGPPERFDAAPTARPFVARRRGAGSEKRTSRRRKAEIPVEFAQGPFQGTGVTGDVSRRGMFVRSPHIPGSGPLLRLTVNLPEGRKLVLKGRVVRNARPASPTATRGFGLRLVEEWPGFEDLFGKGDKH